MEQSQPQAVPGHIMMPGSFAFSITRAKNGGWMLWLASDPEPYAYYSSYEECWAAATSMAIEFGRPFGEMPFKQQQPQLAYHPQQMVRPAPPAAYNMPQPESFPAVVEREREAAGSSLAEQIAKVQRANGRAATVNVAYVCMAAAALWQIWPFGA